MEIDLLKATTNDAPDEDPRSRTSQPKAPARIDVKNMVSNPESRFQFTNTRINLIGPDMDSRHCHNSVS